ncbi:alpha-1,3-glucan synthase Mok12 [Schizosaccharomyces japonicus yFS275]|uniref:alpha-1,3-glucan synthase n=1 Tax=Schizosaccharomyces japonicus (strain yFS275 / FY16936) TaxID=402676 RepID=B6K375_SCHJY|nr:alpha-1,3-glucan synthase Mok12 [Schizosaccharomyces japonicus yFS275]EEB07932.1 alpha-1,3-glucan synthase Mok12 [Schizosaccharomyces japonicus yFS275]
MQLLPLVLLYLFGWLVSLHSSKAAVWTPENSPWNLNGNHTATSILDYYGEWKGHEYFPSPSNWRTIPFYTIILDKWANALPENDIAEDTVYESDPYEVTFRAGGDIKGLVEPRSLDYLESLGVKAIYIAGTPFQNLPWAPDGYSPLDFTLLDKHTGTIQDWQDAITKLHERGFYLIIDLTVSTLSELTYFKNTSHSFANASAPFSTKGYTMDYKNDDLIYSDFQISNGSKYECYTPLFWDATGLPLNSTEALDHIDEITCYEGDFDQYGDVEAFGNHPPWWRQLSNFASVQDRLRDWDPLVAKKLMHLTCLAVRVLDVDGIRVDKATQITSDFLGSWAAAVRECARAVGKHNFFIPGEVTSGADYGSIFLGRGRQSDQRPKTVDIGMSLTYDNSTYFLRKVNDSALDSVSFHYSVYRTLTLLLGLQGELFAAFDLNRYDFPTMWEQMLKQDDLINANTKKFDPRHLYGITNQDIFRWPSIKDGVYKQMLGFFVTHLVMPGIPLVYYGEEQNLKLLDNQAANYIFGRQPIVSSIGWQKHGCYNIGSTQYLDIDFTPASKSCLDDWTGHDHLDVTSSTKHYIARMNEIRANYPQIRDGYLLEGLGKWTTEGVLPGNELYGEKNPTQWGVWSLIRGPKAPYQDFGDNNFKVWVVFSNENHSITFERDCGTKVDQKEPPYPAMIGPYAANQTVKNLLYPYEEYDLVPSDIKDKGCIPKLHFDPYGSKLFVPKDRWVLPNLYMTKFLPGHDFRLITENSSVDVDISIGFSDELDCETVSKNVVVRSHSLTESKRPFFKDGSVHCGRLPFEPKAELTNTPVTRWYFNATLTGVPQGIHEVIVKNVTSFSGQSLRSATNTLIFRVGSEENPMVNTLNATFSKNLLIQTTNGSLYVNHTGIGADKFRYSLDFGSNYSKWLPVTSKVQPLKKLHWNGTQSQHWEGEHLIVQYWSTVGLSNAHVQHGDTVGYQRHFPHVFVQGKFNRYGYDNSVPSRMHFDKDNGKWTYNLISTWPAELIFNIWGMNPDGNADQGWVYGDLDNDTIIDRVPPGTSRISNFIRLMSSPPKPYLSYKLILDDQTRRWTYEPKGSWSVQIAVLVLILVCPLIAAIFSTMFYNGAFSRVIKFDGFDSEGWLTFVFRLKVIGLKIITLPLRLFGKSGPVIENSLTTQDGNKKLNVLLATLEYDIPELKVRVKIGGLGVMAQLMSRQLKFLNFVWVIPMVRGINYPLERLTRIDPIYITISDAFFAVEAFTFVSDNVTYVLLKSKVFEKQTSSAPYPVKMDDLESAVFYSTWNQCIAEVWRRFPLDIYHVNDYHGALAPLYLLPNIIPCAVSLHNAEFQGLWPLRTAYEKREVCRVFNLSESLCARYVQFGHIFNLLHAIISYVRIHQRGYGVVGVSKKYSKQSLSRYPIFWSLVNIDELANPDPSDLLESNTQSSIPEKVDFVLEAKRKHLKRQSQIWANLDVDPSAQLLIFVGRWSFQKGIDLIADLAPTLLTHYNVQLIVIGPVIDLHGRFAAEKLKYLSEKYPKRLFCRPVFTVVPPFLFAGADFALIPSRDEPFGLVAVEFGRKGVLCIGSKTGGLGHMPGWWFKMASFNSGHLLTQFGNAILKALNTAEETRATMRVQALNQRFPVCIWQEKIENLLTSCIKVHDDVERQTQNNWTSIFSKLGRALTCNHKEQDSCDDLNAANSEDGSFHSEALDISKEAEKEKPDNENIVTASEVQNENVAPVPAPFAYSSNPNDSFDQLARNLQMGDAGALSPSPEIREVPIPQSLSPESSCSPPHMAGESSSDSSSDKKKSADYEVFVKSHKKMFSSSDNFTDEDGVTRKEFLARMDKLNPVNSLHSLCIDRFIRKHERKYFKELRDQKIGVKLHLNDTMSEKYEEKVEVTEGNSQESHNALQRIMLHSIGTWPLYTILLALGQILGASSYQLTLLSGGSAQSSKSTYILLSIFSFCSMTWWFLSRIFQARYILSVPFIFFGISFLLVALTHLFQFSKACAVVQNIAAYVYAISSSTGSLFFAWNFGAEGGVAPHHWLTRACIVHGLQQIWSAILWGWGDLLMKEDTAKTVSTGVFIGGIVAFLVCFAFAGLSYVGLPNYYRQSPSIIPAFYHSLAKRPIVIWFFIAQILNNFWLAIPYGQAWRFFWNTTYTSFGSIIILLMIYLLVIWVIVFVILRFVAKDNSWFPVIFGLGFLCPRWCLEFWSSSGLGLNLPWAGKASPIFTKCVWLTLNLYDNLQGIGLGMMLLQTLARDHVAFTLMLAQFFSSLTIMVSKPILPVTDRVFPLFSSWNPADGSGPLRSPCFYLALICQLIGVFGLLYYYRKCQLAV